MECLLLHVGNTDLLASRKELEKYSKSLNVKISFVQVSTVDEAFEHLFGGKVGMMIIEDTVEGVLDALRAIKLEDMIKHISIGAYLHDESVRTKKEFLLAGADQILTASDVEAGLFCALLKPLLASVALMNEKISKAANLQDKAINDFIMLDLIKAYVPRTIWNTAGECAHLQKMSLPEEETIQTICFGDIKSFTNLSQHLEPKEVIKKLNEVFDVVTKYIYQFGGDVDKFIGDAFLGIFKSASDAIRAMVRIQQDLEKIAKQHTKDGEVVFQFRIGVHTGPVIRGNVGGNERFDNTLIGDVVNTASRLEHIGVAGGVIISEETRKAAKIKLPKELEESEQLRGRDCEIHFYSVFDFLKDKKEFLDGGKLVTL